MPSAGKYTMKERTVYAVQEYSDIPHRTPVGETRLFRSYKEIAAAYEGAFNSHQAVVDHMARYCKKGNIRFMKPRMGKPVPRRGYMFVQRTTLLLPVFVKYYKRKYVPMCSSRVRSPERSTPEERACDSEEKIE